MKKGVGFIKNKFLLLFIIQLPVLLCSSIDLEASQGFVSFNYDLGSNWIRTWGVLHNERDQTIEQAEFKARVVEILSYENPIATYEWSLYNIEPNGYEEFDFSWYCPCGENYTSMTVRYDLHLDYDFERLSTVETILGIGFIGLNAIGGVLYYKKERERGKATERD